MGFGTIVPAWNFKVLLNYSIGIHINELSKTVCKNENNRGKIQIMADIVDLCKAGIRKTHIMYKGNLSYEQINRYLYELLEKELITQNLDDGVLTYRATEKGRSFLQYYNMMLSILDESSIGVKSPISKQA
jgi:predicted transcriptional regulator